MNTTTATRNRLSLPVWFVRAYDAELAETHQDSDDPAYRAIAAHVASGATTVPAWLAGHLADLATHLWDLVDTDREAPPATRAARRRGCAALLSRLQELGITPWPLTGHGARPWGTEAAHCPDCAPLVGPRAPAAVTGPAPQTPAAEPATDAEAIVAEHGEHLRPGSVVSHTDRRGITSRGVVVSLYYRAGGRAAADLLLITGEASVFADALAPVPVPEEPDLGEQIEGWWLILDAAGTVLTHTCGTSRQQAIRRALTDPAVRASQARDGGVAARGLWTADLR